MNLFLGFVVVNPVAKEKILLILLKPCQQPFTAQTRAGVLGGTIFALSKEEKVC